MGVCCIVFDIDGMLFEFFMNFLNIEKNKILRIFFSKFYVFFTFHAISNIKKIIIIWCKKKIGGGVLIFFLEKQFFLISRFMLFSTLKKKIYIEKCPFTYWLNGRWFLQIVDGDSWNLYPLYPLFPCSDFVSQLGGGGYWLNGRWFLQIVDNGRAFYHEIGNIEKCPFTYWLNGGGGFSKS